MKVFFLLVLTVMMFYLSSCENKPKNFSYDYMEELEAFKLSETAANLYEIVGAKHDTAMLLMKDIGFCQSKLRIQMKSNDEESSKKTILDLLTALKKADDGMMNWMREFKNTDLNEEEYKAMSEEEIMLYLKDEEKKIEQVHVDMVNSIKESRSYLNSLTEEE